MPLDLFKLEKLTITAYKNDKRNAGDALKDPAPFVAMFNPASYSQTYLIPWSMAQAINLSNPETGDAGKYSRQLSLTLLLDGTGVDQLGIESLDEPSVNEREKNFFDVTYKLNGEIHEPNYLKITWGSLNFDCRLSAATINYTAFDRSGYPLRAEIKADFVTDDAPDREAKADAKKSPDLTHSRTVRSGDTLPLLTKAVYGSPDSYLDVARYNGLDDFRQLTPGRELIFPPLVQLKGPAARGRG